MAKNKPEALPAPDHGRTPENTPIPGGGSWTWDAEAGAWVENLPPEQTQEA